MGVLDTAKMGVKENVLGVLSPEARCSGHEVVVFRTRPARSLLGTIRRGVVGGLRRRSANEISTTYIRGLPDYRAWIVYLIYNMLGTVLIFATLNLLPTECLPLIGSHGNDLSRDDGDPWLINQFVCPPILCGTDAPNETQKDPSTGPLMMLRVPRTRVSAPYPFFEGDIVLDSKQKAQISKAIRKVKTKAGRKWRRKAKVRRRRQKRAIVKPVDRLWKYGIIPFEIDQSLNDETQTSIHRAHRHIESHTCLRFVHKRNEDKDYLTYINQPGCWSHVGKIGGMQTISLGRGCEKVGTAVHETCHALGFWHEQSRSDRNKYITILAENVAPSGRSQFGKRGTAESYSKGYIYDYNSVMHYGKTYFSVNGKPTIEVRGLGKKLGLDIGQRRGLSDIDAAQLNDIYYCNNKDRADRLCSKGWEYYDGRCYKFVSDDPQQYRGARDACLRSGSELVIINNNKEDSFIKKILDDRYPDLPTWRTAGRKVDAGMVWESGYGRKKAGKMKYTNWAEGHPSQYTTLVIDKVSKNNDTRLWKGKWAGVASKPELYRYPYICERKDYRCEKGWVSWADKCYFFETEKLAFDGAHQKCASLSGHLLHINNPFEDDFINDRLIGSYPNTHRWRTGGIRKDSLYFWYSHNNKYVKMKYSNWTTPTQGNYDSLVLSRDGSTPRFVWRGVPMGESHKAGSHRYGFICEKSARVHCFRSHTKDGRDYRGTLSYTEQGVSCQRWTSHYPHNHRYMMANTHRDKLEGLGDHNYCRNPDGRRSRPWCYVPLKNTVWQYCDVNICK
ncbi:hypothetical protein LSH36_859g01011 [Paralvinella palmiformis]|uniref:Metalloendopeptidase n=1 Tax=Paralvinella palmiformis TaxID=53620 RepID=A0AAD9IZG4_9ANNE|nr:hypothetical protein LSH36_859g01011 [Paralvinella palmiformis]